MDLLIRDINQYVTLETYYVMSLPERRRNALQRKFADYVAREYRDRLRRAVIRQELAGSWKPLNEAYRDSKVQNGLNPGMWIATSRLIESVVVIRTPMAMVVGIDRRKVNKESKTHLWLIAKALEYGTDKIPPRPLFRPIKRKLERDLPRLFVKFLEEGR